MKKQLFRILFSIVLLLIPAHFLSAQIDNEIVKSYLSALKNTKENPKNIQNIIKEIKADTRDFPKAALLLRMEIYDLEQQLLNNEEIKPSLAILDSLEALAARKKGIEQSIVYGLLSQYCYNYALINLQKSNQVIDKKNKRNWGWKLFLKEGIVYQEKALQEEALKRESAEKWHVFFDIYDGNNDLYEKYIQGTLYDIFIIHLLKIYQIEYSFLNQNHEHNYLKSNKVFAPLDEFIETNFEFRDNNTAQAKLIKTFQEWLAFNKKENRYIALVQADLHRLEYALSQVNNKNKQDLYEAAFQDLRDKNKNTLQGAYLDFKWLAYLQQYKSKDLNEKTLEELIYNIQSNPQLDSIMKDDISTLFSLLNQRDLSISLEPIVAINQPSLVYVKYQYVDTLYYKVIRKDGYEIHDENNLDILKKQASVMSSYLVLGKEKIRSEQSTEFLLEGLNAGSYYLFASTNKDFIEEGENIVSVAELIVSNMAFIVQSQSTNRLKGILVDRITGKAIDLNKIEFKYKDFGEKNFYTPSVNISNNYTLDIYLNNDNAPNSSSHKYVYFINEKDTLLYTIQNPNADTKNENKHGNTAQKNTQIISIENYIFTDRLIYRPGQKIYIKGIVLNRITNAKDSQPKVMPNRAETILLKDHKNNIIKTVDVLSNEFGSYDAILDIPLNVERGSLYISVSGSPSKEIKIEEYKRPQFYIEQVQEKEYYTLGDIVKINGKAMAYAGNALSSAKVKYTLKRDDIVIKNSTLLTDAKGEFSIEFLSKKDNAELPFSKEKHTYSLRTDIVDISGETHTHTIDLIIVELSKELSIAMPEHIAKDDKINVKIISKNFDGNPLDSEGDIKIYSIDSVSKNYINRKWNMPSHKLLSKNIFEQSFPQYAFELLDTANRTLVINASFNTKNSPYYTLPIEDLKIGNYAIVITTKDSKNQDIVTETIFSVYNPNEGTKSAALFIPNVVYTIEKNDTLKIPIYTYNSTFVLVEVETEDEIAYSEFLPINLVDTFVLPYKEAYSSIFKVHFSTVYYGRIFTKTVDVNVTLSSQDLQIELLTFRDKMQGGEEETWKIKVSGPAGNKVNAELMATMYDASLDAFLSNTWQLPRFNKLSIIYNNYNVFINDKQSEPITFLGKKIKVNTYKHRILKYASWSNINYNTDVYNSIIFYDKNYINYYFINTNNNLNIKFGEINAIYQNSIFNYQNSKKLIFSNEDVFKNNYIFIHSVGSMSYGGSFDSKGISRKRQMRNSDYTSGSDKQDDRHSKKQEVTKDDDYNDATLAIRENLHETVFFYPRISQNEAGEYVLNFKMNDALTRWKFMLFAHDKNLNWATQEHFIVTQKELMIQPNAPRFLRQGDTILFPAKISNLTNAEMKGEAYLKLYNALTNEPLEHSFGEGNKVFPFYIKPQEVTVIQWRIVIPDNFHGIIKYEMIAKSAHHTDGESNILPVLSNQTLVTKVLPIAIAQKGKTTYEFKEMKEVMANSNTMKNYEVSLNLNASSLYSALSSLNFLQAYPYNCSEQLFSIYYANVTGNYLIKNNPAVQQLYAAKADKKSLASLDNLSASAINIIEAEAAWLLGNNSLNSDLFNDEIVSKEIENIMNLLTSRQNVDGGLSWYGGQISDVYISQLWAKGMGEFIEKGMIKPEGRNLNILQGVIRYLDNAFVGNIKSQSTKDTSLRYNYLYTRSFYEKLIPVSKQVASKRDDILKKDWKNLLVIDKIRLGIAAYNLDKKDLVQDLIKDIKVQIGVLDKFKYNTDYPYYYNTEEIYAQLIELLFKVDKNDSWIDDLKGYLIKNKKYNAWGSTKTTTQVLYALFFYNNEEGNSDKSQDLLVQIGQEKIQQSELESLSKNGTFSKTFDKVNVDLTKLEITNNKALQPINGNLTWRYFENFDKISNEENAEIKKTLLIRKDGDKFEPWNKNNPIKVGDLVRVRIEIKVKSVLGYVHVKDMRAAGFEPIDVFSERKNIQNLSYYQAVSDAAMNFFIDNLNQGTYVLEYDLRATYKGNYNNGVTSVECMYTPEKTAYSKAIRLTIE